MPAAPITARHIRPSLGASFEKNVPNLKKFYKGHSPYRDFLLGPPHSCRDSGRDRDKRFDSFQHVLPTEGLILRGTSSMKKTNFASLLAVAGGLALTTAACNKAEEAGDTTADTEANETAEGECAAEGCEAAAEGEEAAAPAEGEEAAAPAEGEEAAAEEEKAAE